MTRRPRGEDYDLGSDDPDDKDYSVLLAEADKIRADAAIAQHKAKTIVGVDLLIAESNDIFRGALRGAVGG